MPMLSDMCLCRMHVHEKCIPKMVKSNKSTTCRVCRAKLRVDESVVRYSLTPNFKLIICLNGTYIVVACLIFILICIVSA